MFFPLELGLVSFRIETGQGHVLIRKRGLPAREYFICVYPQKARVFSVNEKLLKVDYPISTIDVPIESAKAGKHRVYYYFY